MPSNARGAAKIKILMADLVAEHFKAYDLPNLCVRLGLESGTESEAMSSKRMFMSKRLAGLDEARLRGVARDLAEDIENPELDAFANSASPSDEAILQVLGRLDRAVVQRRWSAALERRSTDPEGAITLARTLLEDVLKWLLTNLQVSFDERADLPVLYRLTTKNIGLSPDSYTEDAFKRILGSCQSIVETLGSLRNKLGDAHSSGPLRAKPKARHAELAVNLSGAMATFLVSTWEARSAEA